MIVVPEIAGKWSLATTTRPCAARSVARASFGIATSRWAPVSVVMRTDVGRL